jgi:hypothetical protein
MRAVTASHDSGNCTVAAGDTAQFGLALDGDRRAPARPGRRDPVGEPLELALAFQQLIACPHEQSLSPATKYGTACAKLRRFGR